MRKLTLTIIALALLSSLAAAGTNRVFGVFGNPITCGPVSPMTTRAWVSGQSYYGVAAAQLGNEWSTNGGLFYRNESGFGGVAGATPPTCTTGTCSDGTLTWRVQNNDNKQCGDDFAHDVYPHIDGVTLLLPWGADCGGTNCALGFETSNGGGTAHGAFSYTAFDATVTNGSTGYLDNPYWVGGNKVGIIVSPIQGAPATGGNTFTPNYVYSTTHQAAVGAASPQDVVVCGAYKGDLNAAMGGSSPAGVFNINSAGVTLANIAHGWTGMQEVPATTAWEAALANAVPHYNAQTFVDFLRIAPGQGGESFMSCESNWASFLGNTQAQMRTLWETTYMQAILNAVNAASPNMPTEVVTNCQSCVPSTGVDYTWSLLTAQYAQAVTPKFWLGGNGLANTDLTLYATQGTTAGSGISSDHANLWNLYPSVGKVFQTVATTDPTGNGTGTLVVLLPFQANLCAAAPKCTYEAFWQDLCIAYCVNYAPGGVTQYTTYHVAYQNAINNFRANVSPPIAGPTVLNGAMKWTGGVKVITQ